MTIPSLPECSQEDGVTHVMDNPDGTVEFETMQSDCEAAWTDKISAPCMQVILNMVTGTATLYCRYTAWTDATIRAAELNPQA